MNPSVRHSMILLTVLFITVLSAAGCNSGGGGAGVAIISPTADVLTGAATILVAIELNNFSSTDVHLLVNETDLVASPIESRQFQVQVTLREGRNELKAYALSAEGEKRESPLKTVVYDTQPPVITFESPMNKGRVNQARVTLKVAIKDASGLAAAILKVNNVVKPDAVVSPAGELETEVSLNSGWNIIALSLTDAVGLQSQGQLEVYYDSSIPQLLLQAPLNQEATIIGSYELLAQVNDAQIRSALLILDGQSRTLTVTGGRISAALEVTAGPHTLSLSVEDAAGNTASTGEIAFYGGYQVLMPAALNDALRDEEDLLLIDESEPEDYAAAHIDGAVNYPPETLQNNYLQIAAHNYTRVVLYGEDGNSLKEAMRILYHGGVPNLFLLAGGLAGWEGAIPLTIEPSEPVVIKVGSTYQFRAHGGAAPYAWSVCTTAYGVIDNTGLYHAVAPGECTISVRDRTNQLSWVPINLVNP